MKAFSSLERLCTPLKQLSASTGKGLYTEEVGLVIYLQCITALPHLQQGTLMGMATSTSPCLGSLDVQEKSCVDFSVLCWHSLAGEL